MATQKQWHYWFHVQLRTGTTIAHIEHKRITSIPAIKGGVVEVETFDNETYIIPLDAIAFMKYWLVNEEIEIKD